MYKEEGVSMGGGCLWSFIPLLILLPLYNVIREPITYMMHNSRSISEAIVAFLQASGENLGKNAYYAQLAAAGHIGDYADKLREVLQSIMGSDVKINLQAMNFQFLGIDLAAIPTFRFWDCEGWSEIGLFLIPVVSAGLQAVSMWISQKMNNPESPRTPTASRMRTPLRRQQTNATMMLAMLMSGSASPCPPRSPSTGSRRPCSAPAGLFSDEKHYRKVCQTRRRHQAEIAAKRRAGGRKRSASAPCAAKAEPRRHHRQRQQKEDRQQEKKPLKRRPKHTRPGRTLCRNRGKEAFPATGAPVQPRLRLLIPAHYGESVLPALTQGQTEE